MTDAEKIKELELAVVKLTDERIEALDRSVRIQKRYEQQSQALKDAEDIFKGREVSNMFPCSSEIKEWLSKHGTK